MASSTNTAIKAIEGRLAAQWATTPIAWPGVHFDPGTSAYVRPTVRMAEATDWTMGPSGLNVVPGILFLDIFTPQGTGYGVIRGYADTLRDIFDRAEAGIVRFRAASGPDSIDTEDTGWIGLQVTVPFSFEETT